jgi:flagellar motor protein MotB
VQTDPASLDLLARIQAQQGNLAEAEKLWTRASQLNRSNVAYSDALRRVATLQKKSGRRPIVVPLAASLSAVLLAFVGWWMLARDKHVSEQPVSTPVAAPSRPDKQAATAVTPPAEPLRAPDVEMSINVQGVTQTKTLKGLRFEFSQGLFEHGVTLRRDAHRWLTELGAQLKPHGDKIIVEIIGTADAIPVSSTSRYRDNVELGLDRARVVYDYLRTTVGLEARMLTISSRGEQQPPGTETAAHGSTRARTVVLRIISRQEWDEPG